MNKSMMPEAVRTSYSTAFKLNLWAAIAILMSAVGRWFLHRPDLDAAVRAGILLAPFIPSVLWLMSIVRWIRGLDELQRRIQQEAWFFSTAGTIFVLTALNLLGAGGIFTSGRLAHGLGWEGTYALALLLWMAGSIVATRRYQ